jgi:XTP/dITP diphosphohydrolase
MKAFGREGEIKVVMATDLPHPLPQTTPLLVIQIATLAQLQNLAEQLQAVLTANHPLTVISATGQSHRQLLGALGAPAPAVFPVQVYIPPLQTPGMMALQALVEVVAQLRHPEKGCPWDLAQTAETLIPYIIEEAYETVDAIRQRDQQAIAEELGDLLLQVILQTQIASETHTFSLIDVAQGITQKLIRRHPHVFDEVQVNSIDEVHTHWEAIKAVEKGEPQSHLLSQKLQRYPRRLPPLMAGLKLSEKAAAAGFEWPNMDSVWAKFHEELTEFQDALRIGSMAEQEAELGDLLFTLVNIARWCQIDPAAALHLTNYKLIERIRVIETQANKPLADHTPEELETLWQAAKQQLNGPNPAP